MNSRPDRRTPPDLFALNDWAVREGFGIVHYRGADRQVRQITFVSRSKWFEHRGLYALYLTTCPILGAFPLVFN